MLRGSGDGRGIGLASTILGTGMSIYGNVQAGRQASAAAAYNARMAQREANISEMRAKDAERRGLAERPFPPINGRPGRRTCDLYRRAISSYAPSRERKNERVCQKRLHG